MNTISILSFIGFTTFVATISYYLTRSNNSNSSEGYFLGGRNLTAPVIAGSLLLTNLSTEQIVGLNGQSFEQGILVMAWETLAAIAMVVTALFLLPRYLKGGITTIPQYLEERYDKGTKTLVSLLFLTGYVVILLPVILYSGAVALSTIFNVPEIFGISYVSSIWLSVWVIGIIGTVYAVFGGLKAVVISDTINAVGLLIGGLLIPFFGLKMMGDGDLFEGVNRLLTDHPDHLNAIGSNDSYVPFSTIFTGMMLVQLFYWGTNQAIIQRALGAKNLREGQKGLMLASFFKILGPLMVVLPGIIAYHLYSDQIDIADKAYPILVNNVLPTYLVGFFAAVLFGAILSSFNGGLNSAVTLFSIDIYKEYIDKDANDKKTIAAGKKFGVVLAIFSMFIAPMIMNAPDGLFGYLQEVNGCYSIPILTIIVVGYTTKYVPSLAAKFGLISGSVLYIISQFVIKPNVDEYPHFLHVMAILFVLNVIIMLVIGKIYPRSEPFVLKDSKKVDIRSWKYAKLAGAVICMVVITLFALFS